MYVSRVTFFSFYATTDIVIAGDEQKPSCANCEVKGFTCKYGSDLAFVPPRSGVVPGAGQSYSTITVGA